MAESHRMTAAQLADKLLGDEHADLLRESVAWMAAQLMDAEVTARSAPSTASAAWSGPPSATATAPATGRPGSARSSWPSPSSGRVPTSRRSWSRAGAPSRPWSRWCRRPL